MNIEIKEAAIEQLLKVNYKENEGVRIEAIYVGSCSIYVEHELKIDNKNEDDERFIIAGIPILISSESKKHLPDKVFLNYSNGLGYKLYSDDETLSYNLQLKRVN
ncbi:MULTISPECIES: iron-sulfur cluster biosynthesis family protein [unclassified Bacillus (in: firmicutes)]|uniref:iron-sulfur cluster biosynthesis family protein n=1 Tax=unclassified Bacillus (in: firmicutes) TaxID=185979 RepID=UPI001BEB29BA|nr:MULTISPECIES: iron-sulfur cluster biosynthesis family protein [unclassified Bacillus (in: firmicutes)]MBT2616057.1 iron-sulfur cluster biosynthesis family protein [Bacillus sp. ISL-78]MBT2630190.1 iron-sulfur cluster biosynthesis family protein [Bacillus sp. ISL-101]MBT2714646.1 iron-sulfur cluster biosynthesis family protein [Bacillus sp. ISL-57]